jgi:competence protein ComEC
MATIVVSAIPVRGWRGRRCRRAAVVIDRFDLWRRGAHALWLEADGVRVRTVAETSGRRPWSPHRDRGFKPSRDRP